jgi:bifunctional DNase/RNase
MSELRPVEVVDVVVELPDIYPRIVLKETDFPNRTFKLSIGSFEAVAISSVLNNVKIPRPLTHDLLANCLKEYAISVDVVRIPEKVDGNYKAEIVLSCPNAETKVIDARPSDAIALALRQILPVPIVVARDLIDELTENPE